MQFARDPAASGPLVTGFSAHGFVCGDTEYRQGLKLTPETIVGWPAKRVADLVIGDFDDLLLIDPAPEFLILGTGGELERPERRLIDAIEERGFGIEIMDSRAAARAWGILRGEGRWIAAALLQIT